MIVPTMELNKASDSDTTGVVPFGYEQVSDAFRLWSEMLPQERRQLAERMAAYDAPVALEFADMIIDAIFLAPAKMDDDAEYYRKLRAAIDDPDFFDTTWTEPGSAIHDEEDYFGQPLPAAAQQESPG